MNSISIEACNPSSRTLHISNAEFDDNSIKDIILVSKPPDLHIDRLVDDRIAQSDPY